MEQEIRTVNAKQALGIAVTAWLLAIACLFLIVYVAMDEVEIRRENSLVWEKVIYVDSKGEEVKFEITEDAIIEPEYVIDVSPADIDLMARVVMSESSILSTEAKQAVAETIINRVKSEDYPNSVSEVVYQPNAYSTAWNGAPTPECYQAVKSALLAPVFSENMVYICSDGYHPCGYPYMKIGQMYFGTTEDMITYNGEQIDYD